MTKPCLSCGELLEDLSRCTDCNADERRGTPSWTPSSSSRRRGYDSRWDALSVRARKVQPWCTDCGAEDDLTADHSAAAWRRRDAGKTIRLKDIDVVCRRCNIDRGSTRPDPGEEGSTSPLSDSAVQAETALHTLGGYV